MGDPILFENMLIRKMMKLAEIKENDVFYDLGCGHAQNLIIAASEYGVKHCVGFENDPARCKEARRRVQTKSLSSQVTINQKDFQSARLAYADVVFYGLEPNFGLIDWFNKKLKRESRLIYYANALLPAIKPTKRDYPFYVSKAPIEEAQTEHEWLASIVGKSNRTTEELWREIFWRDKEDKERYTVGFFGPPNIRDLKADKNLLRLRLEKRKSSRAA